MGRRSEINSGINSSQIKAIAAVAMLLDHIGLVFARQIIYAVGNYELYEILFSLGRIAFPLFAFQSAEGARYTKAPGRYLLRLFLFGLLAEIPFRWMLAQIGAGSLLFLPRNVMFTFFLAVSACICYRELLHRGQPPVICMIPGLIFAVAAEWMQMDYGAMGVLLVFVLFLAYERRRQLVMLAFWCLFMYGLSLFDPNSYQPFRGLQLAAVMFDLLGALLSVLVIFHYNGEKGRGSKYFFYLFYPAHLWLLMILAKSV